MTTPVQIENIEEETFEITAAEFEMFKSMTITIQEQNAVMQDSMAAQAMALQAMGENLVATFASLRDAIAGLQITVNVPQQPAPVVTVNVPEQSAPIVNVEAQKGGKVTFTRNMNGLITGGEIDRK